MADYCSQAVKKGSKYPVRWGSKGENMYLEDMDTSHLKNAIKYIEKQAWDNHKGYQAAKMPATLVQGSTRLLMVQLACETAPAYPYMRVELYNRVPSARFIYKDNKKGRCPKAGTRFLVIDDKTVCRYMLRGVQQSPSEEELKIKKAMAFMMNAKPMIDKKAEWANFDEGNGIDWAEAPSPRVKKKKVIHQSVFVVKKRRIKL